MLLIASTISMCFVCLFYGCIKINRYEDTMKAYQKELTELEKETNELKEQINNLTAGEAAV